ncbi:hypothetical protein [Caballeronia calidae]|uniref:hypothetical protein n=1 Tax=Caballeronia calidae TaxID=1777139 RepID=UPI0012FE3409|nr:hypothetical protein [Caballeronia calidae]
MDSHVQMFFELIAACPARGGDLFDVIEHAGLDHDAVSDFGALEITGTRIPPATL